MDTYAGGLLCCHHQNVLLDADQEQPMDVMTYQKFRFYFQPYMPASEGRPASHQNLIRLYWQTEASAGEYDVPKADPTTPPELTIHTITAHWKVSPKTRDVIGLQLNWNRTEISVLNQFGSVRL